MVVPARPLEGAPVDVAWGGVVHDSIVGVDIQSGYANIAPGAGFLNITFPRPFAAAPIILAVPYYSSGPWCVSNPTATATGATIYVREVSGSGTNTVPAVNVFVHWIAIGPRA